MKIKVQWNSGKKPTQARSFGCFKHCEKMRNS